MKITKHLQTDSAARSEEAERRRSAELAGRKAKRKAAESERLRQETMRAALTAQPARRQPALPVVNHAFEPHAGDVPEHQDVESLLRLGLQKTAFVGTHREPISKALAASSSEAHPEPAHEKPAADAAPCASRTLMEALHEIHALRAAVLHASLASRVSPPAGAANPVPPAATTEAEDSLTADRVEARLTFIEAFYSDALRDPAEKHLLAEALAQIPLEADRAEKKQQGADSASDVLVASACEGIAAGIPFAVLAEQLAAQMAGANRTFAKQTSAEPARAAECGTVEAGASLLQGKQALPGSDTLPLVTLHAM
jgi:hypothetical protein